MDACAYPAERERDVVLHNGWHDHIRARLSDVDSLRAVTDDNNGG